MNSPIINENVVHFEISFLALLRLDMNVIEKLPVSYRCKFDESILQRSLGSAISDDFTLFDLSALTEDHFQIIVSCDRI